VKVSTLTFQVDGKPKPKQPAYFDGQRMVNASRRAMEEWTHLARLHINEDKGKFKGTVHMRVTYFFRRPDHHYRRKIRGHLRLLADAPVNHTAKPDADNLAKFTLDCLTGLAYYDDSQIADLHLRKRWSHEEDCTEVSIKWFDRQ